MKILENNFIEISQDDIFENGKYSIEKLREVFKVINLVFMSKENMDIVFEPHKLSNILNDKSYDIISDFDKPRMVLQSVSRWLEHNNGVCYLNTLGSIYVSPVDSPVVF